MTFRFEEFADASCAQSAFEAAFPAGSPADIALQALIDMGAQCKSAGAAGVACRYMERSSALARWCWHVRLEVTRGRTVERVCIQLTITGP